MRRSLSGDGGRLVRPPVPLALAAVVTLAVAFAAPSPDPGAAERPARPNVVVLMTDDQDSASLRFMPSVQRLLAARGTSFTNSFVSYPLCCPARATYLTGQYAHNHRVLYNRAPSGGYQKLRGLRSRQLREANTLPAWLAAGGYETAHLGKYLNGYANPARGGVASEPPGWRTWMGSLDPSTYRMYGFSLLEGGRPVAYPGDPASGRGYQTDVYAGKAVEYIRARAPARRPFFLSVATLAPHAESSAALPRGQPNPRPAPRHAGDLAAVPLPRPPSFDEADVGDKPAAIARRPRLTAAQIARIERNWRARMESLLAVDELVERVVRALRAAGELDRTLIVFTSDNGFMHGEHRIPRGKYVPYEASIRVPLILRGPGVRKGARVRDAVANVDLVPTILEAAGARAGRPLDGLSLLPLARGGHRRAGRPILIETGPQTNVPWYRGVRQGRWKYVQHSGGERELYDLQADPHELRNLAASARHRAERSRLAALLGRLERCAGRACRR